MVSICTFIAKSCLDSPDSVSTKFVEKEIYTSVILIPGPRKLRQFRMTPVEAKLIVSRSRRAAVHC